MSSRSNSVAYAYDMPISISDLFLTKEKTYSLSDHAIKEKETNSDEALDLFCNVCEVMSTHVVKRDTGVIYLKHPAFQYRLLVRVRSIKENTASYEVFVRYD